MVWHFSWSSKIIIVSWTGLMPTPKLGSVSENIKEIKLTKTH